MPECAIPYALAGNRRIPIMLKRPTREQLNQKVGNESTNIEHDYDKRDAPERRGVEKTAIKTQKRQMNA